MKTISVIGRLLFAALFLFSAIGHFTPGDVAFATSQGVPFANILVPFSGLMLIVGALSILLGYKAKVGGIILVLFLLPVTFMMHAFWKEADPMQQQMQLINFLKNISLAGAAIMFFVQGSGPASLDNLEASNLTVAHE